MTLQLKVANMACSEEGATITEAIKAIEPNAIVQADPKTKLVNVETQVSDVVVKEAVIAAGYSVG